MREIVRRSEREAGPAEGDVTAWAGTMRAALPQLREDTARSWAKWILGLTAPAPITVGLARAGGAKAVLARRYTRDELEVACLRVADQLKRGEWPILRDITEALRLVRRERAEAEQIASQRLDLAALPATAGRTDEERAKTAEKARKARGWLEQRLGRLGDLAGDVGRPRGRDREAAPVAVPRVESAEERARAEARRAVLREQAERLAAESGEGSNRT